MYEREYYEALLAVLKKRKKKKVTFQDDTIVEPKRAKLYSKVETSGNR